MPGLLVLVVHLNRLAVDRCGIGDLLRDEVFEDLDAIRADVCPVTPPSEFASCYTGATAVGTRIASRRIAEAQVLAPTEACVTHLKQEAFVFRACGSGAFQFSGWRVTQIDFARRSFDPAAGARPMPCRNAHCRDMRDFLHRRLSLIPEPQRLSRYSCL